MCGKREEESSEGATLFEAFSNVNEKVFAEVGENVLDAMMRKILNGANDVGGPKFAKESPKIIQF